MATRRGRAADRANCVTGFAHTLIPIAFAYLVAHYFSLFVFQEQAQFTYLLSDPLGTATTDLFGTASGGIDFTVHQRQRDLVRPGRRPRRRPRDRPHPRPRPCATAYWGDYRQAARSQYWMLAVMVAFTCFGLYLSCGRTRSSWRLTFCRRRPRLPDRRARDGERRRRAVAARNCAPGFAHTLIPIAFAYLVAHYFSLFVFQEQAQFTYLLSDPLGDGDHRPLRHRLGGIDFRVISANAIWYVQVGALVVGHVIGLTLAHDRATAYWGDYRQAARSQYWMLAVMVAFTCFGLYLLSVANG